MLAVLAAGLVGYALGGWLGVAVGACSATAVTVLLEPLTPPGDRETAHERRMRLSRRYRARYTSLEESWRRPYQPRRRTWSPADRPADPAPTPAAAPTPPALETPEPAPALPARATKRKRSETVSPPARGTGRTRKTAPSPRRTSVPSSGS